MENPVIFFQAFQVHLGKFGGTDLTGFNKLREVSYRIKREILDRGRHGYIYPAHGEWFTFRGKFHAGKNRIEHHSGGDAVIKINGTEIAVCFPEIIEAFDN